MELHCPKCHKPFAFKPDIKGNHREHPCPSCKEFMQWDDPPLQNRGVIAFGPPEACTHGPDRRTRPTGSVPYWK